MDRRKELIEKNIEQYEYDMMSVEDKLINQIAKAISEEIDSEVVRSIGKIR